MSLPGSAVVTEAELPLSTWGDMGSGWPDQCCSHRRSAAGHGHSAAQPDLPGRQCCRSGVCRLRGDRNQRQLAPHLGGPRWPAHQLMQQVREPYLSLCWPSGYKLCPFLVAFHKHAPVGKERVRRGVPLECASTSAPNCRCGQRWGKAGRPRSLDELLEAEARKAARGSASGSAGGVAGVKRPAGTAAPLGPPSGHGHPSPAAAAAAAAAAAGKRQRPMHAPLPRPRMRQLSDEDGDSSSPDSPASSSETLSPPHSRRGPSPTPVAACMPPTWLCSLHRACFAAAPSCVEHAPRPPGLPCMQVSHSLLAQHPSGLPAAASAARPNRP